MDSQTRYGVVAGMCASAEGLAVAELAATEARRRGVGLRLICWPDRDGAVEPDAEQAGSAIIRRFPDLDVVVDTCGGEPAGAIVEASRTACLLAVDARYCCGLDPVLDVWLSDEVITHAHCPVLVVGPGRDPARVGGPVVLGLDGSAHSVAAVPHAFEAASLRRAPLRAIAVHHQAAPAADATIQRAQTQQVVDRTLTLWSARYAHVPVTVQTVCAPDVATALVDASAEADLVVVGARGRSTVTCLVLGSVSRALVERARCPVMVIHAYERAP